MPSLFVTIAALCVQKFGLVFGLKPYTVSVVCYHAVSDDNTIVDVTPENFKHELAYLRQHFDLISLDTVFDCLEGKIVITRPSVALTFDDGYKDVLHSIAPLLDATKIPATLFVMSNPQQARRQELGNVKPLLADDDLLRLQASGYVIGSHTATHPSLDVMPTSAYRSEIQESKQVLERKLGQSVNYLAYPKGKYTHAAILACRQAGYRGALTTDHGGVDAATHPFLVPRICVDRTHSLEIFPLLFTNFATWYFKRKRSLQAVVQAITRCTQLSIWKKRIT